MMILRTSDVRFLLVNAKMKIHSFNCSRGLLLVLLILISGCELTTPPDPFRLRDIDDIRYSEHIQPLIFDKYCTNCHVGTDAAAGLRLDSWNNVMMGSDFGEAVIPFDDDNSLMVQMLTVLEGGPHPGEQDADTLLQVELDFLRRWIDLGARFDGPTDAVISNQGVVPFSEPNRELLFVPNQDDGLISVIDVDAKLVVRTIDLLNDPNDLNITFSPNTRPHDIEVEPDGSVLYVSLIGDNAVLKISLDNEDLGGDIDGIASFETPGMLGLNSSGNQLFVGRSLSAVSPPRSIGKINTEDMSISEIEILSQRPHALAADPGGEFAYTASLTENRISIINTATDESIFTLLQAPFSAFIHFGLSPDGTRLAASGQQSNQVMILDTSAPPGISRIGSIEVGNQPWHPVWTPDGRYVYVGNLADNTVSVIDAESFGVVQTISGNGLAQPHGSSITPDGSYVFISNRNTNGSYIPRHNLGNNENTGTVVVINTATNEIEKIIEVGRFPAGLSTVVQ